MANVINYENFNVDNIRLSVEQNIYSNDTYQFKKLTPKYVYEDGIEEDMYIQLPEGFSYGIKTFDNNNDQAPSHSFSIVVDVKPNDDDNINEIKAKEITERIIKMFEQIQERIKSFLCEENTMKKLSKKKAVWAAVVGGIKPFLSYQIDKETNEVIEGSAPTLFVKLKTENNDKSKNPPIKTVFRQFNPLSEKIEEIHQTLLPGLFQGVRCTAIGVVHIESIYIPKMNNVSIQFKLHEVLITEVMKKNVNRIQIPQRLLKNNKITKIFDSDDDSDSESLTKSSDDEKKTDYQGDQIQPIVKKVIRRPQEN